MATLYKDTTVRQLIVQGIDERPPSLVSVSSFLDAVTEFRIRPASEPIEFVSLNPPANPDVVKMGRPDPGVFFPAIVTTALATIQMYLPPGMEYQYATVSAAVAF